MDSDSILITMNQGEDGRKKFLLKMMNFRVKLRFRNLEYVNMNKKMVIYPKILQYARSKYNQSIKSLLRACVKDLNWSQTSLPITL